MEIRKKIYEIIGPGYLNNDDMWSELYHMSMSVVIVVSILPLMFREHYAVFWYFDIIPAFIFVIDYILRWITADYELKKGWASFILYPFTLMAIIDLLSILPSLSVLGEGFRLLRMVRALKALRVFRVVKLARYSKSLMIIAKVLKRSKDALLAVGAFAGAYILISALIMFNVEPDSFETFFEAVYWATVSLTAVGYGDIYPTTVIGRLVAMVSSVFGIAIVALPAGIITAGYMTEVNKSDLQPDEDDLGKLDRS